MIRKVSVWVKAKVLPYNIEYPGFRLKTLQYTCEPCLTIINKAQETKTVKEVPHLV